MKKIGILTLNGYFNYGNRLQNYATQEVIKELGFSVETIINNSEALSINSGKRKKFNKNLYKITKIDLYKKINNRVWLFLNRNKILHSKSKRYKAFKDFTSNYILEKDYGISLDNIPNKFLDKYDYFIVGSDQVWNPNFPEVSSIYFLTFAQKNKRIAYAPSFGISKIPYEYVEKYRVWLSDMDKLSVREEAGAKIIKDLTGRDAIILVDPTLMLTKEKWLSVSKEDINKPKCKYLLTYFLGEISKDNKYKIKLIAKENKLKIVNLGNIKDLESYKVGPSEFIDYINLASVLFTDSFHGCVFSILLDTPFVVFDREGDLPSMNSRIDTLLKTFRLEKRRESYIENNEQIFEANYSHVNKILEIERKKAINYLKESLNI